MVRGLEIFRSHFQGFADRYVLIGGTACDLAMTSVGLSFRSTKDLDIVLCIEALDADFVRAFWDFVRTGGYEVKERSTGEKRFYRFLSPRDENFPFMLEIFSRKPDMLVAPEGTHLVPIPVPEDLSSLSAILLDTDYYGFILAGRSTVEGLTVVSASHLIALKARAWLDLTRRRAGGETIDDRDIRKHRNDVFRLYRILDPDVDPSAPEAVRKDLSEFVSRMGTEDVDLKLLGLRKTTLAEVLARLSYVYRLK